MLNSIFIIPCQKITKDFQKIFRHATTKFQHYLRTFKGLLKAPSSFLSTFKGLELECVNLSTFKDF